MFESSGDDQKKANAANAEEGMLPSSLRFDGNDEIGINLSSYQYGRNAVFSGDANQKPPSLSFVNEPLGENNSFSSDLISSLMNDQARTPLGLMQEDFPATPSSLYSNRLLGEDVRFESDMQAAELKVVSSLTEDSSSNFLTQSAQRTGSAASTVLPAPTGSESPSRINPLMSSGHLPALMSTGNPDDFEQAAKSLQQLYVNPELSTLTQNPGANPLLAQYHNSLAANASFFAQANAAASAGNNAGNAGASGSNLSLLSGQQFAPNASESVLSNFPLANNGNGNNGNNAPNPSVMANPAPGLDPNASVFNGMMPGASMNPAFLAANAASNGYPGILGNNMQPGANGAMLQGNGVPPLANPSLLQGQMPAVMNAQGQQQQQAPYFVQPPMFMSPNGQPMFFRPPGQFGQDFMYSPQVDANGMPIPGAPPMVTDPSQLQFAQQQMAQGFMQYPGMPGMAAAGMLPPGYWPNGTPDQSNGQAGGMPPMFVNNQQGVRMPMQGMEDPNRMLYNPAMYNGMQAVPGMVGQGNVPGMPFAMNNNMMQMPLAQNANGAVPGMMGRPMMPMNGDGNNAYAIMNPDGTVVNAGGNPDNNNKGGNVNNNNNRNGGNNNDNNNRGNRNNNNNNNNNNPRNNNNSNGNNNNNNGGNNSSHNNNNNNNNGGNNNNSNNNANSGNNNNNNASNNGGTSNPIRDPLVEEFRSTFGKSRQWTLGDLSGHIVAFCQDQHGSRFIQQRLEVCTESEKQLVFDEILPSAQILMTDVFGNYVLQKLFEYGTKDQCEQLALLLKGQAVQLSMQMYGCRVVQKALEYVSTERLVDLVSEFESPQMLIRCVHDSNGNHVIQKCIEVVSKCAKDAHEHDHAEYLSSRIQFIIDAFNGHVKELSSHPYGCRVVQRILEHCTNHQKAVILEELRQCCSELVQDCYGNYVIQFVMQHGWDADRAVLIREVQTNLLDFSQHKFASNVVEKCLQYASKKDRDEMIWTIINVTFDLNNPVDAKGHCVLESMVRDPYANYVVQKVIDVSDERQRAAIMRYVKDNINQLRKYTYGKHIIVRLEKITNEKF